MPAAVDIAFPQPSARTAAPEPKPPTLLGSCAALGRLPVVDEAWPDAGARLEQRIPGAP